MYASYNLLTKPSIPTMKNIMPWLLASFWLLAACSKKKDAGPENKPEEKTRISRLMYPVDTTEFMYHPDGSVKQFKQYGEGLFPDSTQVIYENGNMTRFRMWVMGELRNDRLFQYNNEHQLVRISYYGMISESESAITDYDSLVYKQGKPAELHVINGTQRNEAYKFTWDKDNISKVDYYLLINEKEELRETTTITYSDKPAYARRLPGYFMYLIRPVKDFTAFCANEPLKEITVKHPEGTEGLRIFYEYTYNEKGLAEKVTTKYEAAPDWAPNMFSKSMEYITLP